MQSCEDCRYGPGELFESQAWLDYNWSQTFQAIWCRIIMQVRRNTACFLNFYTAAHRLSEKSEKLFNLYVQGNQWKVKGYKRSNVKKNISKRIGKFVRVYKCAVYLLWAIDSGLWPIYYMDCH